MANDINQVVLPMQERFSSIDNFPGYLVSTHGNVISTKRKNAKILAPRPAGSAGRYQVTLCKNGKEHQFYIHRLVGEAFIPNPDNKPTINHINGIKTDNHVSNLEWATHEENIRHAWRTGLSTNKHMLGHYYGKTRPVVQTDLSGKFVAKFISTVDASKKTGIPIGSISQVLRRRNNTAYGYKWKYISLEAFNE